MTRLDRHVATVQSKLFLHRFLEAVAWTTLVAAAVVLLGVVVQKLFQLFPDTFPVKWVLIFGAFTCVAFSAGYAFIKKPTRAQAAAAIDERLRLKEKFSTAIYVRPSSDPFAMAAVRDAEKTADGVVLGKHFPLAFPKPAYTTLGLVALAFCIAQFVQPMNLFGQKQDPLKKQDQVAAQQAAKEAVSRAIAAVEAMPKQAQTTDEFRKMVAELHEFNKAPRIEDPARANRRALQALQEVNNQVAKDWDKAKKYAEAQNSLMQSLQPTDDAKGPVGEARKEIAKGNFDNAANELEKALKDFDKMDKQAKQEQAKEMEKAANQLAQLANNQQVQQQIQQQLQQMGANQQQAQQMQQLMQQAAQGGQKGQQAAQQLQQMAKQMAQQMNNGQGPNQQQQQQMNQAMQQMQAQANAQGQANALAQAAQQMAQAMQNAAQQQQGQQGQGQGQQNPQQGQQMAQAQAQMKNALQNMQGVKQDLTQIAQQMQQNQQAMQQAQQAANGQNQGQGQGKGQGQMAGQGQFKQGQIQGKGPGQGGPGIGAGGVAQKSVTPFGVTPEQSPSQDDEKGRILASYMVRDKADPGVQKMTMQEVVKKAQNEMTDEVDTEHANRAAQKVAQEYFRVMEKDAPKVPNK
jgi:hypothetical protein